MATAGQEIDNPASGERLRWHLTAADTGGRLVRAELRVRPGGAVPLAHVHPRSEERFELVAGTMGLEVDGARRRLTAGEQATVAAGASHRWWNAGDDELHVMVELEPPLHFEQMMETLYGLARDGRTDERGHPGLLQLAVIAHAFPGEALIAGVPAPLQRLLFALLAPIGRMRGLRPTYPRHATGDGGLGAPVERSASAL